MTMTSTQNVRILVLEILDIRMNRVRPRVQAHWAFEVPHPPNPYFVRLNVRFLVSFNSKTNHINYIFFCPFYIVSQIIKCFY